MFTFDVLECVFNLEVVLHRVRCRRPRHFAWQDRWRRLQLVRNVELCPLMAWFNTVSRTGRGYAFEFKSVDGWGHVAVIYRAWRSFQVANHSHMASRLMAISRLGMDSWWWSSPWVGPCQIDSPSLCFWGGWWNKRGIYMQIGNLNVKSLNL